VARPHDSTRLFEDTSPDVEARMVALWRNATPQQRLAKILGLGRALNELTRAELRRRYPEAPPREIELRLAARNLDRETMIRAFGWDPELHGR
jgi:hypothetical protein